MKKRYESLRNLESWVAEQNSLKIIEAEPESNQYDDEFLVQSSMIVSTITNAVMTKLLASVFALALTVLGVAFAQDDGIPMSKEAPLSKVTSMEILSGGKPYLGEVSCTLHCHFLTKKGISRNVIIYVTSGYVLLCTPVLGSNVLS